MMKNVSPFFFVENKFLFTKVIILIPFNNIDFIFKTYDFEILSFLQYSLFLVLEMIV